jgi:hypothetical protein
MSKELDKNIEEFKNLNISKKMFKTPENYFENFEDKLFAKITEKELPNNTGFNVPKGYFEGLDEKIIKASKNTYKRKIISLKLIRTLSTIAAMFLLYFGVSNYMTEDKVTFDSLTENEIDTWIITENLQVDDYTLAGIVSVDDFSNALNNIEFTEDELLEYLDNSDTDLLDLE